MNKIKHWFMLLLLCCSVGMYAQSGFDPELPPEPPEPPSPENTPRLLTLVAQPAGGGTLSGGGEYVMGTAVAVKATVNTGYKFINWTLNDSIVSAEANFTFIKGEHNETLVAHFLFDPNTPGEPDEPNITPPEPTTPRHQITAVAVPTGGGTVTLSVDSLDEGASTRLSITVNTGYVFNGWFVADTLYTTSKNFTYTMGTSDVHFVARLEYDPDTPDEPDEPVVTPPDPPEPPTHEVTVEAVPSGGGTVTIGTNPVKEGSTTTLKVTPNTGYVFDGWYLADSLCSMATSYTYTMGTSDVHFEARFTYDPGTPAEPNPTGEHRYNFYLASLRGLPGHTIQYPVYVSLTDTLCDMHFQLTFSGALHPQLDSVRLSGKAAGYTYSYHEVATNMAHAPRHNSEAVGASESHTYQFDIVGGIIPPSSTRLLTFSLLIDENAADTVHQVTIGQVSVANTDGTTETVSTHNGSVQVNVPSEEGVYYYLNVVSTGSGQTRINSRNVRNSMYTFDLLEGTSTNVYFIPDAGYHVASVMLDNQDITEQVYNHGSYLIENVHSDMDLMVEYAAGAAAYYPFTLQSSGQGSTTYEGNVLRDSTATFNVAHGSAALVKMAPDPGWHLAQVLLNGNDDVTAQVSDGQYTIGSVTEETRLSVTYGQIFHPLVITTTGNGAATYDGMQVRNTTSSFQVGEGSTAKIAVKADANNHIERVLVNGTVAQVVHDTLTIANIADSTSVDIAFALSSTTLSITAEGAGTVSIDTTIVRDGSRTLSLVIGTRPVLKVQPDAHHRVDSLTVNGVSRIANLQEDGTLTLDSVTTATTVYVRFAQIYHTLTLNSSEHGSITYGDSIVVTNGKRQIAVAEGSSVALTIKADTGYHLNSVLMDGESIIGQMDAQGRFTIEDMEQDVTIAASFSQTFHPLVITASGNGRAVFDGTGVRNGSMTFSVSEGSTARIALRPDANNHVERVTVNGVVATPVNDTLTIANITDSAAVTVVFAQSAFTLTVTSEGSGRVYVDSTSIQNMTQTLNVLAGSNHTLTFVPEDHHILDSLTVNGISRMADLVADETRERVFTLPLDGITAPTTVYAHFSHVQYQLTVNVSDHGSIIYGDSIRVTNSEQKFLVDEGASVPLTIVADVGYHLGSVLMNGESIADQLDAQGRFTIEDMEQDVTVAASFGQTFHPLVITATGNGRVIYDGTGVRNGSLTFSVPEGSTAAIVLRADANNHVERVTVNGVAAIPVNDTLTIAFITDSTAVMVAFAQSSTTLAITSEGNGSVALNGTQVLGEAGNYTANVTAGEAATLTFTPAEHYMIDSLTVNGISRIADLTQSPTGGNAQTLTLNVDSATVVYVHFAQIYHTLTLNATEHGSIAYGDSIVVTNGERQIAVAEGSSIVLTIKADEGYHLGSVLMDGESIADQLDAQGHFTIGSMEQDVTIAASFGQTFHPLVITASGNGRAVFDGTGVRNGSMTFSVPEGETAKIALKADTYSYIELVTVNGVAAIPVNDTLTIANITDSTDVVVAFAQSSTTLAITSEGNGFVDFNGMPVPTDTLFSVAVGSQAVLTFTPAAHHEIDSLSVNGENRMADLVYNEQTGDYTLTLDSILVSTNVGVRFSPIRHQLTVRSWGYGATVAQGDSLTGNREGDVALRNERRMAEQTFVVEEANPALLTLLPETEYYVQHMVVATAATRDTLSADRLVADSVGGQLRCLLQTDTLLTDASIEVSFSWKQDTALVQDARETTDLARHILEEAAAYLQAQNWPWYRMRTEDRINYAMRYVYESLDDIDIYSYDEGPGSDEPMPSRPVFEQVLERSNMVRFEAEDALQNYQNVNEPYKNLVELIDTAQTVMADPQYVLCDPQPLQVVINQADSLVQQAGEEPQAEEFHEMFTRLEAAIEAFKRSTQQDGETFLVDGIAYRKTVTEQHATFATVVSVSDVAHVTIPSEVAYDGFNWEVVAVADTAFVAAPSLVSVSLPATLSGIGSSVFASNRRLSAIDWQSEAPLVLDQPSNPNLLVYVTDASLAPEGVQNVVVDGVCERLVLCDTTDNVLHDFYAPRAFTARHAEYSHSYTLETPLNSRQGWETLTLPFDVKTVTHEKRGEIVPFATRGENDPRRPFWLYGFGTEGYSGPAFSRATAIQAYRPYLIAMPNNPNYKSGSILSGLVTFSADNVEIASTAIEPTTYGLRLEMVPVMQKTAKADNVYTLNIGGEDGEGPGSAFIGNSRDIQPFQCYILLKDLNNAPRLLSLQELLEETSTDIDRLLRQAENDNEATYDLKGVKALRSKGQTERKNSHILLKSNKKYIERRSTH